MSNWRLYNGYSPGYIFGGKFISAASPMALPNENITWFKSKTFDVGFDFEAWNGLLGVSFDYFNRLRTGRFARRTGALPTVEVPLLRVKTWTATANSVWNWS